MPSVPKPSQKKSTSKTETPKRARASGQQKKERSNNGVPLAVANLPQRGKMGAFIKELKEAQGMSETDLTSACGRHKLSVSGTKHAIYLAKRLKLFIVG